MTRNSSRHSSAPIAPSLELPLNTLIAGVDEVGRGALFGPVVAAAVLAPLGTWEHWWALGVRDSKKLSPLRRSQLVPTIEAQALGFGLGWCSAEEIDQHNILRATFLAMERALAVLDPQPDLCLIDGNRPIPRLNLPQQTWVQGDRHCPLIAAASILAKVARDRWVTDLDDTYPPYGLADHKGYGTQRHRQAIAQYGVTPHHRRSFAPCATLQLAMDFTEEGPHGGT